MKLNNKLRIGRILLTVFAISMIVLGYKTPDQKDFDNVLTIKILDREGIDDSIYDTIDIWLNKFADSVRVDFNNNLYEPVDFDRLIELKYNKLMESEVKKLTFANEYFSQWFINDARFRHIIERIDSIGNNSVSYNSSEAEKIISLINNTKEYDKKIFTILYFGKHFFNLFDFESILLHYISETCKIIDTSDDSYKNIIYNIGIYNLDELPFELPSAPIDSTMTLNCLIILGDFILYQDELPLALETYTKALKYAKYYELYDYMGVIYEKIATLYSNWDIDVYSEYIIDNYYNASRYYKKSNNLPAFNISEQKANLSKINQIIYNKSYNIDEKIVSIKDIEEIGYRFKNELLNYNYKDNTNKPNFLLFRSLGGYCQNISSYKNINSSIIYYKASAYYSFQISNIYDLKDLLLTFDFIAYSYSKLKNKKMALKYSDMSIKLTRKFNLDQFTKYYLFEKANNLREIGDYNNAMKIIDEAMEIPSSINITNRGIWIHYLIYNDLYIESNNEKYKNISKRYYDSYFKNLSFSINELNDLKNVEKSSLETELYNLNFEKEELEEQIDIVENELIITKDSTKSLQNKNLNLNNQLVITERELINKRFEIQDKIKELELKNEILNKKEAQLRSLNDSVSVMQVAADTSVARAKRANDQKEIAVNAKNIAWSAFIVAQSLFVIVVIMIIGAFIKLQRMRKSKTISDIHSAISRVLTRCLSHNIGSHALSKYIDKDKVTISDAENQYLSSFILSETEREQLTQPALIASFNEYLKHRMDLLADIATTTAPVMESPMYLVRDIMSGLDKNRILLNRISGVSPRINFSFKVVFNGEEIRNLRHQNDPVLSMTNDLLGAQAFYIILENIIRNIYKHGNPANDFQVVIAVTQCKSDKSFYEINVFDTLQKSITEVEDIVLKRNESFNEPVFYNNKLRDHYLGSIEMAVCSCYLRCLPIDTFTNDSFKINVVSPSNDPTNSLIHAYAHKLDDEGNHSLGYRFFISKPRQVLVVSNSDFQLAGKSDILLKDIGITVIRPGNLSTDFTSKHQFIYLDKGIEESVAESFSSQLPKRIVKYSSSLQFDTIEGFKASLWQQYLMNNYSKLSSVSFKYYRENPKLFFSSEIEAENNFSVYIDNHDSKWICRDCKTINEKCFDRTSANTADCEPLASFNYYDMACGHSKLTKSILRGMFFPGKLPEGLIRQNILQSEYAENVLSRILIIDERIQHNLVIEAKMYRGKVPLYDYFHQQGVLMPKMEEANLNFETFGTLSETESESSKIRNYIRERIDEATFCVIHLGILEKMLKSGSSKSREAIDELISGIVRDPKQRRKLIITSNRGGALNIPNDISYVPFPLVQNALEAMNDKFVLTNILFNTRKCI